MLKLEKFLPYQLSVLSNLMSHGIALTYEERFELSVTEWRVIAILGRHPGITATEVARRAAMDKVAVSRAVSRLLAADRLQRKEDRSDGRARRLFLSPAGLHIHDTIVPAALEFERLMLESLRSEERRVGKEGRSRSTSYRKRHSSAIAAKNRT